MNRLFVLLLLIAICLSPACGGGDGTAGAGGTTDPDASTAGTVQETAGTEGDAIAVPEDVTEPEADAAPEPGDASESIDDATEPVSDTTEPVSDTTEPAGDAGEPAGDAGEPAGDATQPGADTPAGPEADAALDVIDNLAPVAVDDLVKVMAGESQSIPVLLNDSDADGDVLGIKSVTQGNHGVVGIVSGGGVNPDTLEYTTLSPDYVGVDSLTYTIHDGQGNEDTATVTIHILAPLAAPTLVITSPVDGDVIEGDTVTIEFEVVGCVFTTPSINPLGCHGHKFLDGGQWWAADGSAGHGHYDTGSFTVFPLTDGEHTMQFVLIGNNTGDQPWVPAVSDSVTFEVTGGVWEPPKLDFAIHRLQYAGDTSELLLATAQGIYRTEAEGTELTLAFEGPDFVSLAQDAFTPDTYHASGHWAANVATSWGFVTSEDAGASWAWIGSPEEVTFDHLAVSPDQAGLVAASSDGQLHVSTDAGVTWQSYPWTKLVTGLATAASDGSRLYVASPSGVDFVTLPEDPDGPLAEEELLGGSITGFVRVPGGFAYGTITGGIGLCSDTLTDACDMLTGPTTVGVTDVLIDADDAQNIHALTMGSEVYRSVDGGSTWELLIKGKPAP